MINGELLIDIESAHFMQITDLDMDEDIIISAGKDCKVKVWLISDLLKTE